MDAINQNNLEIGMENIRRQRESADRVLQRKIEENLRWLTESEGRGYVSASANAAQASKACTVAVMMRAMFATKPPVRGGQADPNCQQAAVNAIKEVRYENLAYYRKAHKIIPLPKGTDNPEGRDSLAAKSYQNKRFEVDVMALPPESRGEVRALNEGVEANLKLCAEQADALACHEMVTKPFKAAFKELSDDLKRDKRHAEAAMAMPVPSRPAVKPRVRPPMPKDLKLPEHGEYDPYATQKWTCKVGYVQVGDRCQKQ